MNTKGFERRRLLVGGVASALTASALTVTTPTVASATTDSAEPLRAAVLEHPDQWTNATGLAELLRRAGFDVAPLDVALPATGQPRPVDLIAFGSFTNNDSRYTAYTTAQAESLRAFAAGGGVVLDLAQSDQFGAAVSYLPESLGALRTDDDHDTIHPTALDHPLVAGLRTSGGLLFTGRSPRIRTSWETVGEWRSMRVLMGCSASGNPPALLEGAHGRGRFVVGSLTIDKCFGAGGVPVQPETAVADSEAFFRALARYVALVRQGEAPAVTPTPMPPDRATGPLIGHVGIASARVWARPGLDPTSHPRWACRFRREDGPTRSVETALSTANDNTLLFDLRGLRPDTRYELSIAPVAPAADFTPLTGSFTTSPAPGRPAVVTMGLGSCAPSTPDRVWTRIADEGCDSFVMLGDTPYLDTSDLALARRKHRAFLQQPELARLISSRPVWATWDDHDFGGNDKHGDHPGKRNNRTAFVDYRANATFGHDSAGTGLATRGDGLGVYTSFRRGPIEVFLLDPRWFSRTEPSWVDPTTPGCLGQVQWDWLRERLLHSTAPFKALASGMIWDDKQNGESDDWGTYAHEKDALLDFITEHRIPGCFLVGGDIHVSRALNYGPRVGYDLWQFIVSPLHDRTIPSLNVPSPHLVHSAVEPHVFLKLVADTTPSIPTLTATWINRDGRRLFEVRRTAAEMGHNAG
ncbi:alkaline phosphatase D family protein [Streptomyces hydrogenans]|uniref:alkaline phosphatase D family protein n=1 Tax=Streptomyces hydrogenans TaxID=1873719 RepID=UPI003318154A